MTEPGWPAKRPMTRCAAGERDRKWILRDHDEKARRSGRAFLFLGDGAGHASSTVANSPTILANSCGSQWWPIIASKDRSWQEL